MELQPRLITLPPTTIDRKVKGATAAGFVAVVIISGIRYLWPEYADAVAPFVEQALVAVAAAAGGYFTRRAA